MVHPSAVVIVAATGVMVSQCTGGSTNSVTGQLAAPLSTNPGLAVTATWYVPAGTFVTLVVTTGMLTGLPTPVIE